MKKYLNTLFVMTLLCASSAAAAPTAVGSEAVVPLVNSELQTRRENAAAFIKTLDYARLNAVAGALGLESGPDALVNILTVIATAGTGEAFDVAGKVLIKEIVETPYVLSVPEELQAARVEFAQRIKMQADADRKDAAAVSMGLADRFDILTGISKCNSVEAFTFFKGEFDIRYGK